MTQAETWKRPPLAAPGFCVAHEWAWTGLLEDDPPAFGTPAHSLLTITHMRETILHKSGLSQPASWSRCLSNPTKIRWACAEQKKPPQNHELNNGWCFKPLSFKAVLYTAKANWCKTPDSIVSVNPPGIADGVVRSGNPWPIYLHYQHLLPPFPPGVIVWHSCGLAEGVDCGQGRLQWCSCPKSHSCLVPRAHEA